MSEELEKKDSVVVDRESVNHIVKNYQFDFDNITVWHQVTHWVETTKLVHLKSNTPGKYRKKYEKVPVQKTEVDVLETEKAKKNYILSMNPQKKEEILATLSFLSSLLPSNVVEKLNPYLNEVVFKYNDITKKTQQVFSDDMSFMKELEISKTTFRNAIKVIQSKKKKAQKEKIVLLLKRIGNLVPLIISIVVFLSLLGSVWLLYDEFDTVWIPIVMDITLLVMYICVKAEWFWFIPSWDLIGNLRQEKESYNKAKDEVEYYTKMIEALQV